ncbi:protein kinase domain containing protein [Stylonychia lemnae]|uniref:non-specific serine/threonine protein kinase n=1 Tax=Stylonychia lemnae TaxID=5949 RepID=A0A078AGQ8_STYLE|nr:protein kinase domain containing protein [Stylonychia lemnae]|eukprot:CDW81470.1 protein kinase domain containing protein [Stylonychia lemnae]
MSKNQYSSNNQTGAAVQDSADKKNQGATTNLQDFKILTKLGEGAYSSVYKVLRLADMKEYALKKVKLLNLSDKERENALNEVRILASIKQKNVISYKEAFWDNEAQSLCIVMEYCDNGDLFQKICEHQKKGTEFLENEIWKVFIQSANVFLYKDWTAKLGDMNVSKISNYKGLNYTQTGTPYYASPEVWKDEPYDSKSDIWSLGCVLYEMITLKPPFRADDMQGLYKRVLKGVYQKIPNHFSQDLSNVVSALLQTKPSLRPSCEQILELSSTMKRSEKFFPEEVFNDKSTLVQEIRVPKNLMYLTDKLPGPNYEEKGKFYKNRSEVKIKLPKLTGSVIGNSNSQAQIEYQLPGIDSKNSKGSNGLNQQVSITEQVESINPSGQKKNIQQQQIIIQVNQKGKDKKSNGLKVSSLNQPNSGEKANNGINISHNSRDNQTKIQNQATLLPEINHSMILSPNHKPIKALLNEDSQNKRSKNRNRSRASSRFSSDKKDAMSSSDNLDSVLAQQRSIGEERVSVLSQNEITDEQNDEMDDLPPPINSKSPNIKSYSSKLQQMQNNQSRNVLSQMEDYSKLSANINPNNSIIQDDDSPQKQYGYRYSSLQPVRKNQELLQQRLPDVAKNVEMSLPQIKKVQPQIVDQSQLQYQYVNSNVRSLSPYRNPSLIQPIQSKQDLYKLKQSGIAAPQKSQSSGKLPKIKGQDQIMRQMQKQQYFLKGSPKLQNMYYRVANSYLKGYPPQMNIVGNSVKNSYQIYGGIMKPFQDDTVLQSAQYQSEKPKIQKIGKIQNPLKKDQRQVYLQSVIEDNQSIHPLLNRPTKKKVGLQQQSIDMLSPGKITTDLLQSINGGIQKPQFQGLDGMNLVLPKNHSSVLLKYQIQETKQ